MLSALARTNILANVCGKIINFVKSADIKSIINIVSNVVTIGGTVAIATKTIVDRFIHGKPFSVNHDDDEDEITCLSALQKKREFDKHMYDRYESGLNEFRKGAKKRRNYKFDHLDEYFPEDYDEYDDLLDECGDPYGFYFFDEDEEEFLDRDPDDYIISDDPELDESDEMRKRFACMTDAELRAYTRDKRARERKIRNDESIDEILNELKTERNERLFEKAMAKKRQHELYDYLEDFNDDDDEYSDFDYDVMEFEMMEGLRHKKKVAPIDILTEWNKKKIPKKKKSKEFTVPVPLARAVGMN